MPWNRESPGAGVGQKQPLVSKRYVPAGAQALKTPRRCSEGHLVKVWPCLECVIAREARVAVIELGGAPL